MSGGGGANPTGAQFPAPVVEGLSTAANSQFQPSPFPNTPQAAGNAFNQIGGGFNQGFNQFGGWTPQTQAGSAQNTLDMGNNFTNQAGNTQAFWSDPAMAANITNANNLLTQMDPRITQTLQQGFDPQKQLFNQLFNQQQQQNLASQASAGTANTPYGAGLTEQGNQNFDIAWQNAQLARQGQAAQNAAQLAQIPSADYANASTLAQLPTYAAGIGNSLLGTGSQLGTGAASFLNNVNQQQIQDYLAYLSGSSGNAANLLNAQNQSLNAGTNLFQAQTGANQNQQQLQNAGLAGLGSLGGSALGAGLGSSVGGGLGNLFSGAGAGLGLGGSGFADAALLGAVA